jgi:CDP-glucose 4,6-dehydratase
LEPLRGYLAVAESLCDGAANGQAWNFGPEQSDARPVQWIVRELAGIWGEGARWELEQAAQPHETQMLRLDCSKTAARLGWRPELRLRDALAMTAIWYRESMKGGEMRAFTCAQIHDYEKLLEDHSALRAQGDGGCE